MFGQILFPLEKVLGQVYKDKVFSSITAHESVFSASLFQGHFPTEWKGGGACDIAAG